eukprot:CAMPEP_0172001348 /NCGR_PEP_ID=MMETSP1041-20130122/2822_1 /TAXON_ID=464988 /ORGANISM="Hemiselmis andersenii, Strain CCMP439" /LENGTH=199 /DNA_ID=CAMNT_0012654983 /DNA_START=298 /DNA_END=893 /DNA_ORIENTATION=-
MHQVPIVSLGLAFRVVHNQHPLKCIPPPLHLSQILDIVVRIEKGVVPPRHPFGSPHEIQLKALVRGKDVRDYLTTLSSAYPRELKALVRGKDVRDYLTRIPRPRGCPDSNTSEKSPRPLQKKAAVWTLEDSIAFSPEVRLAPLPLERSPLCGVVARIYQRLIKVKNQQAWFGGSHEIHPPRFLSLFPPIASPHPSLTLP